MGKKEPLKDFVKKLKNEYPDAEAYLFGSRAKGEELKNSDYDIIVVSEKFKKKKFIERMVDMQFLWEGKQLLESLCYTPEEFNKMKKRINIVSHAMGYAKRIV